MTSKRVLFGFFVCTLLFLCNVSVFAQEEAEEEVEAEHVLTLDHTNFTETVNSHDFIVVEFYAPWCGHCKKLAPEYEEAARVLSSNEPPLILAKVDASIEENKELATKYEVQGFPTIKILRNGGKDIQEYKGPREALGIASYLKKQTGPASVEIKTAEDVQASIDESKIVVVGIFPEFAGEEFDNFTILANKMRSDYDFCHTLDAKLVPKGESSLDKPTLRLLKPFDELFVDVQEFNVDSMEKFIEEASVPLVTVYDKDPNNLPFVMKFFNTENAKAMLIVDFNDKNLDALKSAYKDIATAYKGQGVSFLLGQDETCKNIMEYFGLKEDQVPVFSVLGKDNKKYYKTNLKSDDISSWFKEYMDGSLKPIEKSEPIPEVNDEPVKVVVGKSINSMVFESGKNVLLEFYAPWCGHCQKLAPILDEVALSYKNDLEILIAKLDATANDFPTETFEVRGFPTLYFKSSKGLLVQYEEDRTKEAIIEFIEKYRDLSTKPATEDSNEVKDAEESNEVKDEL